MTQPLALVLYEKLLPGTQLVNRLSDLRYRVQTIADPSLLVGCAEQEKPIVVFADFEAARPDVCDAVRRLRQNPATEHVPVIGFSREASEEISETAKAAGVTLLVGETALLGHLPNLLQQALTLE